MAFSSKNAASTNSARSNSRDIPTVDNQLRLKPPLNARGAPNGALPDYERGITAPFHERPLALQL
ncbi:hypothetical protein QA649_33535 [Bradyrhizobium sp. CB1717]|uniref:hypothetical protein n=1 Tax=Bradyrhizobium sp. CB1717 TaxID=3039154 RepID=UPI0024B167B1|nr:hypothetical protein [Bradyrhizobium sp. CB1717]WFU22968.1 hypothetical protein QA649_33535 [Bradyrhizobium sp. CB1717]